jgi:hypothetical protein
LFGLTRQQVHRVAEEWPLPNLPPDEVAIAVKNSFNLLLSYPHRKHDIWPEWISADQQTVNDLLDRLVGRRNETPFQRMM